MRKAHLVHPDPDDAATAVAICGQFRIAIPFPWGSHLGRETCRNCERVRLARGLGFVAMKAMPERWVSVQMGGWTFRGELTW